MKVLVTGAAGFTGSSLVKHLAASGDQVRAMARRLDGAPTFPGMRVEVVQGDLTDPESVRRAVRGIEVIYNIAARYREAGLKEAEYRAVNATAVGTIVSEARAARARRVVHCSTVGVHGDIEHPPANEDAPFKPGDIYQQTKLEGERLAVDTGRQVGMDVTIVRPTGIYGPGDARLFKIFGRIATGRFIMLGSGRNYYHLTYIDDLCEAFRLCGAEEAARNRTYIIGGPEVTTVRELVARTAEVAGVRRTQPRLPVTPFWLAGALCEAVCAPLGIAPPLYRRRVDFFRKSRSFDISRARHELGYDPTVGVREGIRRTLEWYRAQGWI